MHTSLEIELDVVIDATHTGFITGNAVTQLR